MTRTENAQEPWRVDDALFPAGAPAGERLRSLVRWAVLAPSGHNTQPWLFRIRGDALELLADRTRALAVVDPADRELTISCGAALLHLRVAASHFGRELLTEPLPDPGDPDLLARVSLGGERAAAEEEERMFASIPVRRTDRSRFAPAPVPDGLLRRLGEAARREGARLHPLDGEARHRAADLVAEGDRIQMADPRFRRELAAWLHGNRSRRRDGIPGYAFGMGDLASLLGPLVIRTFDLGNGQAAKDRELAEGSPVLAVLATSADDPRSWLAAGQALARMLLLARAEGVSASYLNQPIEVAALRPELRTLLDEDGEPQILFRMGYGTECPPTPRRGLEDVVVD